MVLGVPILKHFRVDKTDTLVTIGDMTCDKGSN